MSMITKKMAKLLSTDSSKKSSASSSSGNNNEYIANDAEKRDILKMTKTLRYGFPNDPSAIAFDMVQRILAVGTKSGIVKLYGDEFIETTLMHPTTAPVLFMSFVINEGVLLTYCEDSVLSFWSLRQKQPAIAYSKKLVNEKASTMYLPFQNTWLYIGTERGNVYVFNFFNNFSQSGYDIKWNNLIEMSQKTHPGRVVHISEHPLDKSKLLIGYDSGLIVLWCLKSKKADYRFNGTKEELTSISWFHDGKQFVSSHENGCLFVWNLKNESKILRPHVDESDLIPIYNRISKVCWESKSGESMLIFSDGLPQKGSIVDAITIMKNKTKILIEMKEKIIDFLIVQSSPWPSDDPMDPVAVIVLLENNIVSVDLKSEGFPKFNHHHAINLHEVPISCYEYIIETDWKLIEELVSLKERNHTSSNELNKFSQLQYPVFGGIQATKTNLFPYSELIITGHDDGSVKLWEASGICLNLVHKIKTHKVFEKKRNDVNNNTNVEMPLKITNIVFESDYLAVAGAGGFVILYKYNSKKVDPVDEGLAELTKIEIPTYSDANIDKHTFDKQHSSENPLTPKPSQSDFNNEQNKKLFQEPKCLFRVKIGCKSQQGYQPDLVCLFTWMQKPPVFNSLVMHTKLSLLLIGTNDNVCCVDYQNRTLVFNIPVCDFYLSQDIGIKVKSPKKIRNREESFHYEEVNGGGENTTIDYLVRQLTFDNSHFSIQPNKENSKSSSCSSLVEDHIKSREGALYIAVNEQSCLSINHSRNEQLSPANTSIWVGSSDGTVTVLTLNNVSLDKPSSASLIEQASTESMSSEFSYKKSIKASINNTKHTLKGQIVHISFLDSTGTNISTAANPKVCKANTQPTPQSSLDDPKIPIKPPRKPLLSSRSTRIDTTVIECCDKNQFAVLCSNSEIKVISLPSNSCTYKYSHGDETTLILKANVISVNNYSYLACYMSNGSFLTFNLPYLKPNATLSLSNSPKEKEDIDLLTKTFTFGTRGHAFYMCSKSELQKLIVTPTSTMFNLNELAPELFDPKKVLPSAPKPSFFKSIFSASPLDREQLFGEASGKPSICVIKNSPYDAEVQKVKGELSELQRLGRERGEKLSQLEKRTEEMTLQASAFAKNAHDLANKYKKKSQWFN